MGSTAKILFGSFLAICIVGMFLLFSMQKSAQLSLDMEAMQLISSEKDNKITTIISELQSVKSTMEQIQAQNALIPKLKQNLETTEKEKIVYVRQLDDFQAELQTQVDIAKQRLTEIASLQDQQSDDQLMLSNLKSQSNELTAALEITLSDLNDRTQKIQVFTETLVQKDRVIEIYKDKLDKAAEDVQLLKTGNSNEQLNLVLILDELAEQTALAKDLGRKLAEANNDAIASDIDPATITAVNEGNQALVEKLSLENDYLGTGLKELNTIIKELQTKQAAAEELLASFATEIEQLQFLVADKDKELAVLQLSADGSEQSISQLTATLTAREEEIVAVKKQTQGIAAPLTEKITGLELQITQATTQQTSLTEELTLSKSALKAIGEETQLVNDELTSTKVALEATQEKYTASEENQAALLENIDSLEQQLAQKKEIFSGLEADLAAATVLAAENDTFAAGLNEQLTTSKKALASQNTEQEERIARLIDEVAAAQAISTELTAATTNLQARNDELLSALAAKEEQLEIIDATEAVEVEEVKEVEEIIEEAINETETAAPETEETIDTEPVTEIEPEIEPSNNEVIEKEEEASIDEDQGTLEEEAVVVEAEEIVVEVENAVKEVTDQTTQSAEETEELPLQEDSENTESL